MTKEITEIVQYESGLSVEKHNALASQFNPLAENIGELIATAKSIVIRDASDVESMSLARKTRLELKAIRVETERTRKSLKESAVREGKAIDGMANIIKFMIVPAEEELREKEEFVARQEAKRIADLAEKRRSQLVVFGINCECFNLGNMADEAFDELLSTSKAGFEAKKKAEQAEAKRIEDEKAARAKAERERAEQERIEKAKAAAEAEKLRLQAESDRKLAETERAAREKAEAEAHALKRAAAERERKEAQQAAAKEQAKRDAELAAAKAAQARLSAPDVVKLQALDKALCGIQLPAVSSDAATEAIKELRGHLRAGVIGLRARINSMQQNERS